MKYRHKFSYGTQKWEWVDIRDLAKYKCEELSNEYDGEHYRGIDYETAPLPPKEILEEALKDTKIKISYLRKYAKQLKEQLEKL